MPLLLTALAGAGCSGGGPPAAPATAAASAPTVRPAPSITVPASGWPAEKQALHVLNRLAFGPAPGDVEAVVREGVANWMGSQMRPAALVDAAVEAKLRSLPTLAMTVAQMQEAYPRPVAAAAKVGLAKDDPAFRQKARAMTDPDRRPAVIGRELVTQKLVRAIESKRQLQEVLTDFWFNHFNVFIGKGEDRWLVTAYERDAIRPNVLGTFRDLLGATAAHPAMLFYLDNWRSVRDGPNENYARELLELHTLGVDGGYTQEGVREVARCFTGWSIVPARQTARRAARAPGPPGTFIFREAGHDRGRKVVLGTVLPAGGGRGDGEKVLDLLARQPATARLVATKLSRKFVRDDPPAALVERVATVFLKTGGDLPSVYAAVFSSPEFWSDEAFGAKTKTPLELAASAVRAVGGTLRPDAPPALAREVARMGEPLYQCQPPTGYKETADAWVNTGSLLHRLNFGLALAAGRVPGVEADVRVLLKAGERGPADVVKLAGLLLGSPEFQRR